VSEDKCLLCLRDGVNVTKHHLIPKTTHTNKKVKKKYSSEEMNEGIMICRPCHSNIHALYTEKELLAKYTTLDSLQSDDGVVKFSKWVSDKPSDLKTKNKRSNRRK